MTTGRPGEEAKHLEKAIPPVPEDGGKLERAHTSRTAAGSTLALWPSMKAKHLVTAGLCDNGGEQNGPRRCANTELQGPDPLRASEGGLA